MANIVLNAAVSKIYKDKASGIATALRGKSVIGLMDVRPVAYQNKTKHIAGLKYDKAERTFFLTSPKRADDVNIGIFISTYKVDIVHGKIMAQEEMTDVYELPSVAAKFEIDGYPGSREGLVAVFPKKVNLKIMVATATDKLVLRNSKGFIFTCDFKAGRWTVLKPGTTLPQIFSMKDHDFDIASIFRHDLPFPALDRSIFDKSSTIEFDSFDLNTHILESV